MAAVLAKRLACDAYLFGDMTGALGERTDVLRSAGEILGGAAPRQRNAQHLPLSAARQRDATGEPGEARSCDQRWSPQLLSGRPHRFSGAGCGLDRCVLCLLGTTFVARRARCSWTASAPSIRPCSVTCGCPVSGLSWMATWRFAYSSTSCAASSCHPEDFRVLELDGDLAVRVFVDELRGFELPPEDFRVLELDGDLAVRVFVDELRGLELPPEDFRVLELLVCCATGPPKGC